MDGGAWWWWWWWLSLMMLLLMLSFSCFPFFLARCTEYIQQVALLISCQGEASVWGPVVARKGGTRRRGRKSAQIDVLELPDRLALALELRCHMHRLTSVFTASSLHLLVQSSVTGLFISYLCRPPSSLSPQSPPQMLVVKGRRPSGSSQSRDRPRDHSRLIPLLLLRGGGGAPDAAASASDLGVIVPR